MNGQVTRQQCLFVVCVVLLSYRHGRQQTMFALYNFVTHVAQRKTTGTCVRKNVNNGNVNNGNKQWQQQCQLQITTHHNLSGKQRCHVP